MSTMSHVLFWVPWTKQMEAMPSWSFTSQGRKTDNVEMHHVLSAEILERKMEEGKGRESDGRGVSLHRVAPAILRGWHWSRDLNTVKEWATWMVVAGVIVGAEA